MNDVPEFEDIAGDGMTIAGALSLPGKMTDDHDELRAKLEAYVTATAKSYKAIAKEIGLGPTTLTEWRAGRYRGNNENVAEALSKWLNSLPARNNMQARLTKIPFTLTRSAEKFLAVMQFSQTLPTLGVIIGGPGVGKTDTCVYYKQNYPNVWLATMDRSMASPYASLDFLRETMGIAATAPHKTSRAIAAKARATGGLIIIDEAQHLKSEAIDQMRSIYDAAGIGMVFVGNESLWERIDGGGRDQKFAQLFSRVGIRVRVADSSSHDINAILDAAKISDDKHRARLRAIGRRPGALRSMLGMLTVAQKVARDADEELRDEHIDWAWNNNSGRGEAP